MKIKLNSYKLLFQLLDILSNSKWLHKMVINKKIYLGATIISLSMANSGCSSSKMNANPKANANLNTPKSQISDDKTDSNSGDLQNTQNQDTSELVVTYCYKPVFNEKSEKDSSNKINTPDSLETVFVNYDPAPMCYIPVKIPDYTIGRNSSNVSPLISNYNTLAPDFNGENLYRINELASNIRRPKGTEKIHGTVFVQFTITKEGTIRNVRIQKGVHPLLDEEIVKVVRNMHNWVWPINYTPRSDIDYVAPIQIQSNEN
jgi:TonB family protein